MHKISYQCYAYIPNFYANKNLLTNWLLNTLGLKLLLVTHFVSNFQNFVSVSQLFGTLKLLSTFRL